MTEISPLELLHRALRFWWVAAAGAVLGGLLGLLFASFHAPLYEASSVYRVAFDETRAPEADFRDIETAKQAALDIFFSLPVQREVSELARAEGILVSQADFQDGRFTVQRINGRWLLAVRSEDPHHAAMLANAWSAAAQPQLEEAYSHALAVELIRRQIGVLETCFMTADLAQANVCADTGFANRAAYADSLQDLRSQQSREALAAVGLEAALTLQPGREAVPPTAPVHYGRNTLVLAGLLLGFLLGVGLTLALPLLAEEAE